MHSWGDDWPHWDELYKAGSYISSYVYKYSRCRIIMKEKWGSLRYEWVFPPGGRLCNVSSINLPFVSKDVYVENRRLKFKYYLGNKGKFKVVLWKWVDSWLYRKWERLGKYMLNKAIKSACIKFPNVKKEILIDAYWLRECK